MLRSRTLLELRTATATGLSAMVEGEVSHDWITPRCTTAKEPPSRWRSSE
jgi:hypothetical protein